MIISAYPQEVNRKLRRVDQIRSGQFNAIIVQDTLYKQLMSVLPDYMHSQVIEAYRFNDQPMKNELQAMLMKAVVEDMDNVVEYA